MKQLIRTLFLASLIFLCSARGRAAVSPIGVSLVPPIEFPPEHYTVALLRLSALWGRNRHVYGLDIGGLGNVTEGKFVGSALAGVFNLNRGRSDIIGFQFAGITNINIHQTNIFGVQLALGINSNQAASHVVGLQLAGLANYSPYTNVAGAQIGLFNRAHYVYGFQIGLINVADNLHGIQIGLVNFNKQGLFAISPAINIGF